MLNLRIGNQENRLKPRITVIGVGGAGGNAVNNMIHSNLEGCEFLVCNTDAQALEGNAASHKIQLGAHVTRGLGAGANPEIGRAAAEESIEDILGYLEGSNMVFVTAGMGGGTGTGAASVIAQAAREAGILTIGVVTKPFQFEGTHRMRLAESGITELQKHVDTLIVIPNQNLFRIANEKTTFADAFRMADEVLQSGVRGVTDLMVMPGLINLDFADVRAVMAEMGKAMMGTGYGEGERRATDAAEKAISNPLLDGVEIKGAKGVLINVIGGSDITLFEVDEAVNRIREEVDPDANIIFGSTFDENLSGGLRISVVATGIDAVSQARGTVGETARRPITSPARSLAGTGGGGYAGYAAERPSMSASSGGGDFLGAGAIPPSIIPSQAAAARPTVTASAGAPQPVAKCSVTVRGGPESAPAAPAAPEVGHTEATAYTTGGSAARKLEEAESTSTWTTRPAVTQNYDRSVPPPGQPRAARMGNAFIPPKPVDPHAPKGGRDLFAGSEEALAAPVKAQQAPAAPAKPRKSPSLFERFSLRDRDVAPAPAPRAEVSPKLSVEEGGKAGEEDLDIPAFLRRQAN